MSYDILSEGNNVALVEIGGGFGILLQGERMNKIITVYNQTLLNDAIRRFQSDYQLHENGAVGNQTLSALILWSMINKKK